MAARQRPPPLLLPVLIAGGLLGLTLTLTLAYPNSNPNPDPNPNPNPNPNPKQAGCDFYGRPSHAIWFHIPSAHRKGVLLLLLGNTSG